MREEHYTLTLHAWSYCAFFAQFFGYFLLSALIEVYFYKLRSEKEISWKIQPNGWKKWPGIRRKQNRKNTFSSFALSVPLLDFFTSSRPDENNATSASSSSSTTKRHPKHKTFASLNLVVSSLFALMVTELTMRGKSRHKRSRDVRDERIRNRYRVLLRASITVRVGVSVAPADAPQVFL